MRLMRASQQNGLMSVKICLIILHLPSAYLFTLTHTPEYLSWTSCCKDSSFRLGNLLSQVQQMPNFISIKQHDKVKGRFPWIFLAMVDVHLFLSELLLNITTVKSTKVWLYWASFFAEFSLYNAMGTIYFMSRLITLLVIPKLGLV
jgi:hypothetical protein